MRKNKINKLIQRVIKIVNPELTMEEFHRLFAISFMLIILALCTLMIIIGNRL